MITDSRNSFTDTVLMVRPANFAYNEETAKNNAFQSQDGTLSNEDIKKEAVREFDNMVAMLREEGIRVEVIEDLKDPVTPDAVFPNNWFTTHDIGLYISYPMYAESRRIERRDDIFQLLEDKYNLPKKYSFDFYENEDQFLEGTGSLILDRTNRIAYACLSKRTDIRLLDKFCVLLNFKKVVFHALLDGQPIYHTNVMMCLGRSFVVVCLDSVRDKDDKKALIKSFNNTNKEIIEITIDQMNQFAGNMLQLSGEKGDKLAMSQAAYNSLNEEQILNINKHCDILAIPVPTIEKYGGGSVRCMMAEIFYP